jgi:putative ABC transport system permease protein
MGISILRGSGFTEEDRRDAPPVAVLSAGAANLLFGEQNPVGRQLRWGPPSNPWLTVAGVVGDVRLTRLETSPEPVVYVPYSQIPASFRAEQARYVTIVLRTAPSIDAATLSSAVRQSVWSVDGNQPIAEIKTMAEVIQEVIAPQRFYLMLVSLFAAIAVCLGMSGIYAVVSYFVSRRTQEIGIRVALGANAADVVRLVVWQGLLPTLTGAALGIIGALALSRLLVGLLYGVSPRDLPTYITVCAAVLAAAGFASYIPARRATCIDPLTAIRHE